MANQVLGAPYAEQVVSSFDIWKPEKLNKLFRIRGQQGADYFNLIKSLGFEIPVARDSYSHYEENWIWETFSTTGASAGAAGAAVTYTLDANSYNTVGSGTYFFPRQWDTILFPNEVTGTVLSVTASTVSPPQIVVRPSKAADALPAVTSGAPLVVIANGFAEGADETTSRISGTTEQTNYLQIIKEALTATGSEMTNQDWFDELAEEDGGVKKILGYFMKGQLDMDYRMGMNASNALLFQKPTDNTNIVDPNSTIANNQIQTTEGLIPVTRRLGQILPYTPGTFNIAKFDEVNKLLDKEFCSTDILCLLGIDIHFEIDNTMVDYMKETMVDYTSKRLFNGDTELCASVDFNSIKKGGRYFNFKRMGIFSHPKVGGASGYNYSKMGLFLPVDLQKDKKTGDMIPSFGCRYKKLGSYSRQMEMFNVSGAGPGLKVLAKDVANWYQRMHIGAQHIGANRFVMLDPS